MCIRDSLPGLEAGDPPLLVHGEVPPGAHLAPGVVAVAGDEGAAAVRLVVDLHVAVGGEDLLVDPLVEVPVVSVVGHGGVGREQREEGLAVVGVDCGDEGADGRVAQSRGLNRHGGSVTPGPHPRHRAPRPSPPPCATRTAPVAGPRPRWRATVGRGAVAVREARARRSRREVL